MIGLTKKQREILEYIEDYIATHRFSPSFREIGDQFGFSSLGSVYNHIRSLKKKGALIAKKKTRRSLYPKQFQQKKTEAPLIGTLRGGKPIEMLEKSIMLPLPNAFDDEEEERFFLKVQGEGLCEEGIMHGDLLIVDPKRNYQSGETIIALIGGHTTLVKQVFSDPPFVRFVSANAQLQPLVLREDHVEIQGVVVGLIRYYSSS